VNSDRDGWRQSGMALVLTLLTISFLVAITMQLMLTVDRQISVATAQREQVRLDAMVVSGLNLVRAALAADLKANNFESLHDDWATFESEKLQAVTGDVALTITVTELGGRLQVNALGDVKKQHYREVWLRFLLSGRFAIADKGEAEALLDALGDWIDEDSTVRQEGAEESYYRTRNPAHACRNGAVTTLEELLLVKGMTPELLFGDADHEGIAEFITVIGDDGMINLNTAPLPVVQALAPEMTKKMAQELIDFRKEQRNARLLADTGWYQRISGFTGGATSGTDLLTVTGKYFKVEIKATMHQFNRTGTGILLRSDRQRQTLLQWKIE
jgi:general secretion pathway protein K